MRISPFPPPSIFLVFSRCVASPCQILAEYQKRGKKFVHELEFVAADVLTCLFANFAAVWLSCPTVAVKASKRGAAKAGGAVQVRSVAGASKPAGSVMTEPGWESFSNSDGSVCAEINLFASVDLVVCVCV